MPNVAQSDVLAAIAALISPLSDVGVVFTDEKFVENEAEFINLFKGQNEVKGWVINFSGFPEQVEDSTCDVVRNLKYTLEFLYPYNSVKDDDGKNSHTRFREVVEAVNDAFNADRYLGLGSKIEHQFLKTAEDFVVRRWEAGAGSVLTHYGVFELVVNQWSRY